MSHKRHPLLDGHTASIELRGAVEQCLPSVPSKHYSTSQSPHLSSRVIHNGSLAIYNGGDALTIVSDVALRLTLGLGPGSPERIGRPYCTLARPLHPSPPAEPNHNHRSTYNSHHTTAPPSSTAHRATAFPLLSPAVLISTSFAECIGEMCCTNSCNASHNTC